MNEEMKKTEVAKEELKEGQQEVAARQKRIRLGDRSEYGWATVEAYNNDELAEDPADEKRIADAEKEAAEVTKKGKPRGRATIGVVTLGSAILVTRCQQLILALVNYQSCDLIH